MVGWKERGRLGMHMGFIRIIMREFREKTVIIRI